MFYCANYITNVKVLSGFNHNINVEEIPGCVCDPSAISIAVLVASGMILVNDSAATKKHLFMAHDWNCRYLFYCLDLLVLLLCAVFMSFFFCIFNKNDLEILYGVELFLPPFDALLPISPTNISPLFPVEDKIRKDSFKKGDALFNLKPVLNPCNAEELLILLVC